jgi:DNA-binding NarL/FixJ family response regulator
MDIDELYAISKPLIEAWNDQDVVRVVACYTDDLIYVDPNTRGAVEGPDALTHYLTKLFSRWRPLATRIARALADLGEQVDRRLGRMAEGRLQSGDLTRRQVEILRLVALGRTNKAIAQELFLSPRTVEMHVGDILASLDCRSRAEAVRRAGELHLL